MKLIKLYALQKCSLLCQYINKPIFSKASRIQKKKKEPKKLYLGSQLIYLYRNREGETESIFKYISGET